jgi:hypothetical protein
VNYEDLVADFSQRTKRNLELIEQLASEHAVGGAFEVTQLVNSMLGLLVFPQQRWFDRIPLTPVPELVSAGWPTITVDGSVPGNDLRGLARYLRNGIAHFNLEFIADTSGLISGLRIWNVRSDGRRDWTAQLGVADLRFVAMKFVDMLSGTG